VATRKSSQQSNCCRRFLNFEIFLIWSLHIEIHQMIKVIAVSTGILLMQKTCKQVRGQVLRFGGAKYIFRGKTFVLIICLKQIFLGTTHFGRAQKYGEAVPPWLRACFWTKPDNFSNLLQKDTVHLDSLQVTQNWMAPDCMKYFQFHPTHVENNVAVGNVKSHYKSSHNITSQVTAYLDEKIFCRFCPGSRAVRRSL